MPASARPRSTPRKTPRQPRSQATVDAILDAAARVFVNDGYDQASTNRIADVAGVSIGSLYQYFPGKDAIVGALVERHVDRVRALLRAQLAEVSAEPFELAASAMVRIMLDAHLVDPKLHKLIMEQLPLTGRLDRRLHLEREMHALIAEYLRSRAHELGVDDIDAAAFVIVNAVQGVTHAAVLHDARSVGDDAIVRQLTRLVVRFLGA